MPTLFLSPRQTPDAQALWRAAIARGWDVHRLQTWRVPEGLRHAPEPVLYAEALFGPTLAEELGLDLLGPEEEWLPRLPQGFRRRDIHLTTLGAVRRSGQRLFVKPPNDKSFPAAVYAAEDLPRDFDEGMTVLTSDPVRFVSEHRGFVLDRRIRAASLYARHGDSVDEDARPEEAVAALAFANLVLGDESIGLPRACVLDVGQIDDGSWAVIEANAAWGAGIYRCDPDAVLEVVCAASQRRSVPPPRGQGT